MTPIPVEALPEDVFAAPTWLLDGRLFSLGNPEPLEIWRRPDAPASVITDHPLKEDNHEREDAPSFLNGTFSGPL